MSERSLNKETQLTHEQIFEAGQAFLRHFGLEIDPKTEPEKFREALAQLDPRYQGGRELVRWQLEADQTEWDEDTKSLIMQTAESMRMLEQETPLIGEFDAVFVLGGARQANPDRARYAVKCAYEGAKIDAISMTGSTRELNDAEIENVSNYAPGARTEADLLKATANMIWDEDNKLCDQYRTPNPKIIFVNLDIVENPKAGTPEVLESAFATLLRGERGKQHIDEGSVLRVGVVTTQIYQASTSLDAERVAKKLENLETYTAGNPSDPNVIAKRTPATYMSEILRTLRAALNSAEAQ